MISPLAIGVTLPGSGRLAAPEALSAIGTRAELLGFDSIWLPDHIAIPEQVTSSYPYSEDGKVPWHLREPWLDPLVALGFLAAQTKSIRLGTSVLVVPLRRTLAVAKQSSVLDFLSGGRLMLGVGTGWLREEFELLQADFQSRGALLTEAIQVMKACWDEGLVSFEGQFHSLLPFSMEPKPRQGAALPVLCGGKSRSAINRAALVCDGWHPSNIGPEEYSSLRQGILARLTTIGRSAGRFIFTVRPGRSVEMNRTLVSSYRDAGADHVVADLEYRGFDRISEATSALDRLAKELL